jgi:hypothetical protein
MISCAFRSCHAFLTCSVYRYRRYDSPRTLLDDYDSSFSALVRNTGEENEGKLRELAGAKPPR